MAELAPSGFTYPNPGFTDDRTVATLAGYRIIDVTRIVGSGVESFKKASEILLSFDLQRMVGISVSPDPVRVEDGATMTLRFGWGPFRFTAPSKVVYVRREPALMAYAYGTLTGHPESGEVRFELRLDDSENVSMRVHSVSRPVATIARIGRPVARFLQSQTTGRYIEVVAEALADG